MGSLDCNSKISERSDEGDSESVVAAESCEYEPDESQIEKIEMVNRIFETREPPRNNSFSGLRENKRRVFIDQNGNIEDFDDLRRL